RPHPPENYTLSLHDALPISKDKEQRELDRVVVAIEGADEKVLKRGAERGRIIGESVNFTRDLANEPGVFMTPTILADRAKEVARDRKSTRLNSSHVKISYAV